MGIGVLAKVMSCTLVGVDAVPVEVEVEVTRGLPAYHVVGLPAQSVKEGSVRVEAALGAMGKAMPLATVTVNLAPADLKKPGCGFDLPILLGVLGGDEKLAVDALHGLVVMGELGLDGAIRSVKGTLAAAMLARSKGWRGVLVPRANAHEAVVVEGIEVYCAGNLSEILSALQGGGPLPGPGCPPPKEARPPEIDMSDVRGQALARAAIEIAVAGGHNVLLVGPPGNGLPVDTGPEGDVVPGGLRHEEVVRIQAARAELVGEWAARMNAAGQMPACACGCGGRITALARHRSMGLPRYLHGHHPNPLRRTYAEFRRRGHLLVSDVAKALGVSATTLRRMEEEGVIPRARRLEPLRGKSYRVYTAAEVRKMVKGRAAERWRAKHPGRWTEGAAPPRRW